MLTIRDIKYLQVFYNLNTALLCGQVKAMKHSGFQADESWIPWVYKVGSNQCYLWRENLGKDPADVIDTLCTVDAPKYLSQFH